MLCTTTIFKQKIRFLSLLNLIVIILCIVSVSTVYAFDTKGYVRSGNIKEKDEATIYNNSNTTAMSEKNETMIYPASNGESKISTDNQIDMNLLPGTAPSVHIIKPNENPDLWVRSSNFLTLNANVFDAEDGSDLEVEWFAQNTISGTIYNIACDNIASNCSYRFEAEPGYCNTLYYVSIKVTDSDGHIVYAHAYANVFDVSCEGIIDNAPFCSIDKPDLKVNYPSYCESVLYVYNNNNWTQAGPTRLGLFTDTKNMYLTVPPLGPLEGVYLDIPLSINYGYDADDLIQVVVDFDDHVNEYFESRYPLCFSGVAILNGEDNNRIYYDRCGF